VEVIASHGTWRDGRDMQMMDTTVEVHRTRWDTNAHAGLIARVLNDCERHEGPI
jgi:hypothetical protein